MREPRDEQTANPEASPANRAAPDGLEERRAELEAELERIKASLKARAAGSTRPAGRSGADDSPVGARPQSPRRSLRAKTLDLLEDLGSLSYTRQLGPLIEATYGGKVPSARFGVLARDEEKSFRSGRPRSVYLAFGLTERGEPIKRLFGRSDWPLERRVVAPSSGRVQHLMMAARLAELALDEGRPVQDRDRLRYLAADHARDLPGVVVRHGEFDLAAWHDLAERELQRFLPEDEAQRKRIAAKLGQRGEHAQLFGREVIEGGVEPSERIRGRLS